VFLTHEKREDFDAWMLTKVQYFTVVYHRGQGKPFYRHKKRTMKAAERHARSLKRPCMIYGVCGTNGMHQHTVHVKNVGTKDSP
jgi:hypothetical protein